MTFELIRQNKKFILGLIITAWILTTLPALYGFIATPPGFRLNGIEYLTPGDFHLYLSYFEQAKQGHILFSDLYTGEEQIAAIFNPFFLMFGWLGKALNLPNVIVHHLARIILIPSLVIALFALFSRVFQKKSSLRLAMILAMLSSGLGVFAAPFFENNPDYFARPMDLWVPEFNIFLTIMRNPLYIAALTLIILTFLFFASAIEKNKIRWSILSGLSALLLFSIHPYHVLTVYAIPFAWIISLAIINKKINYSHLKHFIILFLISLPPTIYMVYLTLTDPIAHNRYNAVSGAPPALWVTIISYGLLFFLAVPSILDFLKKIFKKQNDNQPNRHIPIFCLVWLVFGFLIIYFPFFKHGRRLTMGLQIPLIIFSTLTLINIQKKDWYQKLKNTVDVKIVFFLFFILFFASSNVYALINNFQIYTNKYSEAPYTPIEIYKSLNWLKLNTKVDQDVVLSSLNYGNLIPGIIGRTVYIGHSSETTNYKLKEKILAAFFSKNRSVDFELNFLKDNRITHIFYTDNLKNLGTWRPENKDYLTKVFENEKAAIYKVR